MSKIKIDTADRLFSIWIRLRDKECVRCRDAGRYSPVRLNALGLPVSHETSHFKGRGKEPTRYEPLNCDTLCYGCHQYFTAQPDEHTAWQIAKKGQEVVDMLIQLAWSYKKKDRASERAIWRAALLKDYGVVA